MQITTYTKFIVLKEVFSRKHLPISLSVNFLLFFRNRLVPAFACPAIAAGAADKLILFAAVETAETIQSI